MQVESIKLLLENKILVSEGGKDVKLKDLVKAIQSQL